MKRALPVTILAMGMTFTGTGAVAQAAPVSVTQVAPVSHSIILASPGPAEEDPYCGPGYVLHGARCEPIRTMGESPANRNKRSAFAWIAFAALAAASLLNPLS